VDHEVQRNRALIVPYPSGMTLDRHAEATALGARTVQTHTLAELVKVVRTWGVDGAALARTLQDYRRAARGEAIALDAPLPERPSPLATRSGQSRSSPASRSRSAGCAWTATVACSITTTVRSRACSPPALRTFATLAGSCSASSSAGVRPMPAGAAGGRAQRLRTSKDSGRARVAKWTAFAVAAGRCASGWCTRCTQPPD
jgi:hypothetical protein